MRYPDARRLELVETIHGQVVADPYRWLEDADAPETLAWGRAQDELWAAFVPGLPGRDRLRRRLEELVTGFVGPPVVVGRRHFWLERAAREDHPVLFVADDDGVRSLVDPSGLSADHTTTLDAWSVSHEGDLLTYQLSEGGNEESSLWVMDVATGGVVDGPIDRTRYSPVAWLPGGEAFYYVRRLPPAAVPPGEEQYHRRVWLHRVGGDPEGDVLVFGEQADKTAYFGVDVARDGRWAALTVNLGTAPRNDLYVADLAGGGYLAPAWRPVLEGADVQAWPHLATNGRLYLLTDLDAPRRRLCVADPSDPAPAQWAELVAEDPEGGVLESFALAGERVVVVHSRHALSAVGIHHRYNGRRLATVILPGPGTAEVTGRPDEGPELWVGYSDFLSPYRAYPLDGVTGRLGAALSSGSARGPAAGGDADHPGPTGPAGTQSTGTESTGTESTGTESTGTESTGTVSTGTVSTGTELTGTVSTGGGVSGVSAGGGPGPKSAAAPSQQQVTFASLDGTPVRMFVLAPPGALSGDGATRPRPTILYGYGGFNVPMTPAYSSSALAWVQAGGVYAVACLRGGSEEGEAWHRDGMRQHKQHVFEDFEAAASWLVERGWTTPDRLAIMGGSNGGLLVGAALTRHPERYGAVVCSAPLLDMVRYERFGLGATWADEYGTAAVAEELAWLLGYSPYHHVVPATAYPAVLFTVFDGDTRVDPLHARKMCAALQAATSEPPERRPILLRREAEVGHGARSVSRTLDLAADQLAFVAAQVGLDLGAADGGQEQAGC